MSSTNSDDNVVAKGPFNTEKGSVQEVEDAAGEATSDIDSTDAKTTGKESEETKETEKNGEEDSTEISSPAATKEESSTVDGEVNPPLPARKRSTGAPKEENKPKENPILGQLKEAFPNLEEKYIKAVIIASQGALDPAFNALLFLSDPQSGEDIELPTEPIKDVPELPARRKQSQVEQDELLARQLDQQFNKNAHRGDKAQQRHLTDGEREARRQRLRDRQRRAQQSLTPEEQRELYGDDEDSWAFFVEKDLPVLREKANRSIQETATKLNGWFSGIRKNLVGEYPEENGEQRGYNDDPYAQVPEESSRYNLPKKPERHRFNSFGAQVGEDSLENHGITLQNDDGNDDQDDEDDVPPQIASKEGTFGSPRTPAAQNKTQENFVAQTTYIDTPDASTRKKWQPVPPEPVNPTPTKIVAKSDRKNSKNADEDEFLINSEDEM